MVLIPDIPLQNLNGRDRIEVVRHIAGLSAYHNENYQVFQDGEWCEGEYVHGVGTVAIPNTQVERDLKAGDEPYARLSQNYYYVWGGGNALDGRIIHRETGEVLYTDDELVAKRPYVPEYSPLVKRAAAGMGIPAFEVDRMKEIAQYYAGDGESGGDTTAGREADRLINEIVQYYAGDGESGGTGILPPNNLMVIGAVGLLAVVVVAGLAIKGKFGGKK